MPSDLRQGVALSEKLGRAMFEEDEVSARAADALRARASADELASVRGWLAIAGPWWRVAFVVADGSAAPTKVGFEVNFPQGEPPLVARARLTRLEPPRAMDPEESLRWRAVVLVRALVQEQCSKSLNYVVLPGWLAGRAGLLVYLLASTDKAETQVWGGHHRYQLNADATQVLSNLTLSQCATYAIPQGTPWYTMGTPFFDAPNEGHFFSALSNRTDFYLATRRGVFKLNASGIVYKGPHPRGPFADAGQTSP